MDKDDEVTFILLFGQLLSLYSQVMQKRRKRRSFERMLRLAEGRPSKYCADGYHSLIYKAALAKDDSVMKKRSRVSWNAIRKRSQTPLEKNAPSKEFLNQGCIIIIIISHVVWLNNPTHFHRHCENNPTHFHRHLARHLCKYYAEDNQQRILLCNFLSLSQEYA